MEAFTHMGNHLVSDSAATINAGDDLSTLDPDESILSVAGAARRRRHDDDDDASDILDDDDLESLASVPVGGNVRRQTKVEEEKELPPHACA
jgi:regulator of nonsense transcripts 1